MVSLLLVAALLAPEAAPAAGGALWRFLDPYAAQLREAVQALRGDGLQGHLITDAELNAWLASLRPEGTELACVDDRATCPDPARAVLQAVGLTRRIDATAARTDLGWRVELSQLSAGDAAPETFRGEGDDLRQALSQALNGVEGQGSVRVTVVPEGATLRLNGQPLGTGSGTYPARPGRHTLRAEHEGRRPVEVPVTVERGQLTPISVELPVAAGRLVFVVTPPDAAVLLNGEPYLVGEPRDLPPGDHTLQISAPGYTSARHTVTLKPGVQLDLALTLTEERSDWWAELQKPHPDPLRHVWLARADLRFDRLAGGKLRRSQDGVQLDEQTEALGLTGLGLTVTWRSRLLIVDALSLTFAGGGGPAKAEFLDGPGELRDALRVAVRPAWFGVRYPLWRVEPYAVGGPLLAFDGFDAVGPGGDQTRFSATAFALGLQLGARYFFSPEWFAHLAFDSTFWFGERPTAGILFGGGYAFDLDLPEWL